MPPTRVEESSSTDLDSASFSQIISNNRPLVLRGLASAWPACQLWAGPGGLAHLDCLAGEAAVQVMGAPSPVFRGDMYSHIPLSMSFSSFLAAASAAEDDAALPSSSDSGDRPRKRRATGAPGSRPSADHQPAAAAVTATAATAAAGAAAAAVSGAVYRRAPGAAGEAGDLEPPPTVGGARDPEPPPAPAHLYLAQAPIASAGPEPCGLAPLQQDLGPLPCLRAVELSSTNLWMSTRGSRSNLHYDPYQNLLCVVRGAKRLRLFSPAATPYLYPMPLYGESPNHSEVDVTCPDLEKHPLYPRALQHELVADLGATDALYLPDGWWHQVDSEALTAAVNHWWKPSSAATLAPDAAPYHLRRILRVMAERRCSQLLDAVVPFPLLGEDGRGGGGSGSGSGGAAGGGQSGGKAVGRAVAPFPFHGEAGGGGGAGDGEQSGGNAVDRAGEVAGEAAEERALKMLVMEVGRKLGGPAASTNRQTVEGPSPCTTVSSDVSSSDTSSGSPSDVSQAGDRQGGSQETSELSEREAGPPGGSDAALGLRDDVTRVFAALAPAALRRLLAAAAERFPRTLEALLLHVLRPAAAELMTRKLERDDAALMAAGRDAERADFYTKLYGVCGDERSFHALLRRKEEFLQAACAEIMCQTLGMDH